MIAALLSDPDGIFTFRGFEGCRKDVCHLLPTAIVEFSQTEPTHGTDFPAAGQNKYINTYND